MKVFVHREGKRLHASCSVHPRWGRIDRLQCTLSERECQDVGAGDLANPTGCVSNPIGRYECETIGVQVIHRKGDFTKCT